MTEEQAFLTVNQFAAQLEVSKHPSQIYGWIKRGLPFEVRNGKKMIPFDAGVDWMKTNVGVKRERKRESERSDVRMSKVQKGDYVSWSRGNRMGPAYGLITKITPTLLILSVEYRSTTIVFPREQFEQDLEDGVVKLTNATDVASFILQELARLDFLLHMLFGPEEANKVKDAIHSCGVLPANFIEWWHEYRRRPPNVWPKDDQLIKEVLDA